MNNVIYLLVLLILVASAVAVATKGWDYRSSLPPEILIARTLHAEAGCEDFRGKIAVATVIYNRKMNSDVDWHEVILKPKQFSCWNNPKETNDRGPSQRAVLCRAIARGLIDGEFEPTGPWTHYYNPKLCTPSWADSLTEVRSIGRHRFGVLNDKTKK
jgi:N-acetylmuramoyl-L-alanine amidase